MIMKKSKRNLLQMMKYTQNLYLILFRQKTKRKSQNISLINIIYSLNNLRG